MSSKLSSIIVDTKELSKAVGSIISIVDRTYVNPIFGNAKITTHKSTLTVSAINIESSISKTIAATSSIDTSFTVCIKMFYDITRKILDEQIEITYDEKEQQMTINGQSCQFFLSTLSAKDYPTFAQTSMQCQFDIKCEYIIKIFEETESSMSFEEARYNLNGVHIHYKSKENVLRATATDCHRLGISEVLTPIDQKEDFELIIPRKTVVEIIKFAKNTKEDSLQISIGENLITIENSTGSITSKLIDGIFPPYENLIPHENNQVLNFNANHFSDIIDRVSSITGNLNEKLKIIQLCVNNETLTVKTANTTSYNCFGKETIKLKDFHYSYQGEEINIGFNPKYLLDICRAVNGIDIQLLFKDSLSSVLIEPLNSQGDTHTSKFIVMPLKIPNSFDLR